MSIGEDRSWPAATLGSAHSRPGALSPARFPARNRGGIAPDSCGENCYTPLPVLCLDDKIDNEGGPRCVGSCGSATEVGRGWLPRPEHLPPRRSENIDQVSTAEAIGKTSRPFRMVRVYPLSSRLTLHVDQSDKIHGPCRYLGFELGFWGGTVEENHMPPLNF